MPGENNFEEQVHPIFYYAFHSVNPFYLLLDRAKH